jgi:hypothetical protein
MMFFLWEVLLQLLKKAFQISAVHRDIGKLRLIAVTKWIDTLNVGFYW